MLLVKPLNVCLIFRWMHNYSVTCLAFQTHSFQSLEKKKKKRLHPNWNEKHNRIFFSPLYHFKKASEQICFQSSLRSILRQLPAAGWEKAKVSLKSNKTHMTWNCTILSPLVTIARFLCHSGKDSEAQRGFSLLRFFSKGFSLGEAATEGGFVGYFSFRA